MRSRGTKPLKSISCSGLGLSGEPEALSTAIKRLDCASPGRRRPAGLKREADVHLEYPSPCPDANSLQTPTVGLLLGANDMIDFSKRRKNAQPGGCGNCGRFAENERPRIEAETASR